MTSRREQKYNTLVLLSCDDDGDEASPMRTTMMVHRLKFNFNNK